MKRYIRASESYEIDIASRYKDLLSWFRKNKKSICDMLSQSLDSSVKDIKIIKEPSEYAFDFFPVYSIPGILSKYGYEPDRDIIAYVKKYLNLFQDRLDISDNSNLVYYDTGFGGSIFLTERKLKIEFDELLDDSLDTLTINSMLEDARTLEKYIINACKEYQVVKSGSKTIFLSNPKGFKYTPAGFFENYKDLDNYTTGDFEKDLETFYELLEDAFNQHYEDVSVNYTRNLVESKFDERPYFKDFVVIQSPDDKIEFTVPELGRISNAYQKGGMRSLAQKLLQIISSEIRNKEVD